MRPLMERLTGRAIRVAAQRWPEAERDEAIGEWPAELHMIGDHPWRAFRYATSLALTRPDRELGVAPNKAGRSVRSAAILALVPFVGAALSYTLLIAVVFGADTVGGPPAGWYVAGAMLLLAVPLGFGGRWLGRRSVVAGSPYAAAWTVLVLAVGVFALTGAMLLTGFTGGIGPWPLEVATLAWTATVWLAGWGLLRLRQAGHRISAAGVGVAGGIVAWVVAVTVAGLLETSAVDTPRAYALMWPVVLLVGSFDEASVSGGGIYWWIVDDLVLLPFLLIPATVFGLAYLAGAGRPTRQAPAPALDTA